MKEKNYYIGLDIGTDSVGYAVTDTRYNICKFKGEPMWGVTLFDAAQLAVERRKFRAARRRLDRRQQRVQLISELFAQEIAKLDKDFFKRIKESYLYPDSKENKVRLFDTYQKQKWYVETYPTIHHLIDDLMKSSESHDVRLVYIACAWLVAHRGHFLSEVDKNNIAEVIDFSEVYRNLVKHITRDGFALPWSEDVDVSKVEEVLKTKSGITKKAKSLSEVLFNGNKAPSVINDAYEYNYDLVIKLLCGGKVPLEKLFDKEEYSDLEESSVALDMDDEKLTAIMQSVGDDAELITILKAVYDWSVLVDVLKGKTTISEAKIETYLQHQKDLKFLKYLIKKYIPKRYDAVFRSQTEKNNYVAYIGKNKTANEENKVKKSNSKEEFCKYILSVVKTIKPDADDFSEYSDMISRLELHSFLPKQIDGDNRVIPYQLYWHELNQILKNAKAYIPFLDEKDTDGLTGAEKILSVFEFKVPYYVGPLKEKSNKKLNHWMERKAEGKIYPWNFKDMVDLDKSEEAFIARMTNTCTYLPGEDVLPKNSLVYCAFEVLNEINNIKINGNDIPVEVKQNIYENVFMAHDKVTVKQIRQYLESNGFIAHDDIISGLDISVKSSLKPFRAFKKLVSSGMLSYKEVERIISRATYSEDKSRFDKWLRTEFSNLPESEVKYISGLKFKEFGRLSKKLLCGIEGADKDTGETFSVIRAMWETNCNFMQILSDRFTFEKTIEEFSKEYYDLNPKSISDRLDEMRVSNAVKRPIIRTLDILKDVVKVQKIQPKMIFIEMARGANENEKGQRTNTRLQQILSLYEKVDTEDVRLLKQQLDEWGDMAHNKLQSDKLFLYFMQLGKCLYTGEPIPIASVISGDGEYNIEHIYPRSFVKDDSVLNNKILVNSKANGDKSDKYPIDSAIQEKMSGYWTYLKDKGLIESEKYKRLKRTTHFTEEEKFEFINRQLVETRQSTKVVATLLKEIYPDVEVVYVKAGLVSDFRKEFDLLKSRTLNDLHHAKDAYLNIVAGSVWHHKFSRRYFVKNADNNIKTEIVFKYPVKCGNDIIWEGKDDIERVTEIARKNTAHITMYSFYKHSGQNGGFFDQNPVSAKTGLVPLKNNSKVTMPTEIYGGYNGATIAGFILARYTIKKKKEVSFVPLKLLDMKKVLEDDSFALEYIQNELGENATDIEILLDKRVLKIYTMIALDGARFCVRGKGSSTEIGLMNIMPFVTSYEFENYIRRLESFEKKIKKNEKIVWDEMFDGISPVKNQKLYEHYIEKLSKWPYNKRPGNAVFVSKLAERIDVFKELDVFKQTKVLLQIQGMFGRVIQSDLKYLNESDRTGITRVSMKLSNWKKNYTDVRIVDQSASGFFEKVSDNLLDLL